MLKKGDKMVFREIIYLTDSVGAPMVFPTVTTKSNKGILVKVTENLIIKLANPGDRCEFVELRPKNKIRVSFLALSGKHIQGDVEAEKVKPMEMAGVK